MTRINYVEVPESSLPIGLRFEVLRQDQGQMVENAWGHFGSGAKGYGDEYLRITDRTETRLEKRVTYWRREKA